MEEQQPAGCHEGSRYECDPGPGETERERGDQWEARKGERCREQSQPSEPEAQMGDCPREQEVERRSAPIPGHVLDDTRQ